MWTAEGRQADPDPTTNSRMVAGQGGLYESRSVRSNDHCKSIERIKNGYGLSRKNSVVVLIVDWLPGSPEGFAPAHAVGKKMPEGREEPWKSADRSTFNS